MFLNPGLVSSKSISGVHPILNLYYTFLSLFMTLLFLREHSKLCTYSSCGGMTRQFMLFKLALVLCLGSIDQVASQWDRITRGKGAGPPGPGAGKGATGGKRPPFFANARNPKVGGGPSRGGPYDRITRRNSQKPKTLSILLTTRTLQSKLMVFRSNLDLDLTVSCDCSCLERAFDQLTTLKPH